MSNLGLVEVLFFFGIVLALALWELYRTPRPGRDDSGAGKTPAAKKDDRA